MEYLFENPVPLILIGLVLLTFTGVLYFTTRSVGSFVASVVIVVLMVSALVMEQIVFTERELIAVAIGGITNAAEENDMPRVISFLAPSATKTRAMVEKIMPKVKVEKANIMSDIDITFDDPKNPTRATAKFTGFFFGRHGGISGGDRFPVTVELVRDEHRWLIDSFTSDKDFESEAAKLMR
jgi:hypothetical protein